VVSGQVSVRIKKDHQSSNEGVYPKNVRRGSRVEDLLTSILQQVTQREAKDLLSLSPPLFLSSESSTHYSTQYLWVPVLARAGRNRFSV
jgi:hypothetical protein